MSDLSYLPPRAPEVRPFAEPRAVPLRLQVVGPEPTLRGLLRAAHDLDLLLKRHKPGFWALARRSAGPVSGIASGWIERLANDAWRVELWSTDGRLRTSMIDPSYAEVDLAGRLLGLGRHYLCYLVQWSQQRRPRGNERPMSTQTTTRPLTVECNTCPACQTRREVPRPADTVEGYVAWDVYYDAQDAAAELDCHCDHVTCASLDPEHDPDECEWCEHRYDLDEDVNRDR